MLLLLPLRRRLIVGCLTVLSLLPDPLSFLKILSCKPAVTMQARLSDLDLGIEGHGGGWLGWMAELRQAQSSGGDCQRRVAMGEHWRCYSDSICIRFLCYCCSQLGIVMA